MKKRLAVLAALLLCTGMAGAEDASGAESISGATGTVGATENISGAEDASGAESISGATGTVGATENISGAENVPEATENAAEPADPTDIAPAGTTYSIPNRKPLSIPGADNPLTEKQREKILTPSGREILSRSLEAGAPYRRYIREKLREYNMPPELEYLPVVESNFKTNAVSRTGATGMWQFMENSMHPFLKKNTWYDERLDPWLSTDAALKKLMDNYKMFGDWAVAIGAYNCGAGAMKRALKQHPGKDFWYLAEKGILRSQTAHYVPKLLAIADISENAEYYGALEVGVANHLTPPDSEPVHPYSYATTRGMYSLSQISELSGIPKDEIEFLNPSLKRHCTPAGETYRLRVPEGMAEATENALEKAGMPKDVIVHKVVKGDSLWAISRKYGVSVQELCTINNIKENAILSIGQTIIIPIFK